ncbi:MAG: hypothetical protein JNN30_20445 [Rhodanobacteraceae bacterium]|nr:hypothetical protein [Rhodanobacteraceae bacterium]
MSAFAAMLAVSTAHAAAPFLAPAIASGSIPVSLCPTENLAPGARLVTFGVPFPRGSLSQAGLATVRLLRNGVELPIYVDQLAPWRHRTDVAIDGASVRIARIQLNYTFSTAACESVQLVWGTVPRTQSIVTLTPPRSGWHTVQSGTFVAADAVEEPDVFAVLPRAWLSNGVLKGVRSLPFDDAVAATRDDPQLMSATQHWPGYSEIDRAQKNNFYSAINEDDARVTVANQCPYKTAYEPWLYDRASTMYTLHFRSGTLKTLREAVRASDYYADRINAQGFFTLRDGDTKYAYAENIAYTAWLTGDTSLAGKISAIVAAHDSFSHVWQNDPGRFWTERHAAFKLLANVVAYEFNGGSVLRDKVNGLVAELARHQNGAGGAIPQPAGFIDGGLYHYGSQHDSDWNDAALGASSWMSVLLVDALTRAYASAEDVTTATIVRRLGNFLSAATVSTPSHLYSTYTASLALPRYAILSNGADGQVNAEDVEHALDVASGLAWAAYFAESQGFPSQALRDRANAVYFSYDIGVNYWIRPAAPASGATAFRVSPWRKWAWEHRVAAGFGWAMTAAGDTVFADAFE